MAEEKEDRKDAKRDDAENRDDAEHGKKLDMILSHLDSLGKRMDAYDEQRRHDAESAEEEKRQAEELKRLAKEEEESGEEEEKEDRKDAKRDDRKDMKRDDEEEEETIAAKDKKRDDSMKRDDKKRDDSMKRDDKKRDDGEEDCMDDRKDESEEEEREHEKEKEETRARADKKRHDSDLARIKADAEAYRRRTDAELSDLKRKVADRSEDDRSAMADAQARADDVYSAWGRQAPHWLSGETLQAYRVRLAREMQPHSKAWKDTDIAAMAKMDFDKAFVNVEGAIYADAAALARSPSSVAPGTLRKAIRHDREMNRNIIEYHGSPSVWMRAFMQPGRAVTRFNSQPNRSDG
jgi:hypothetical protein